MQRGGTGVRTGEGQLRQGQWTGAPATSAPPTAGASPLLRTAGLLLLAAHLVLVGWYALRPVPVDWVYDANLRPFSSIHRDLAAGTAEGYRQIAVRLLMLAPLGVLLPLAGGRVAARWLPSLLRTAGTAALLGTGLAFLQTGIAGHVLDVDDVLLNLIGVILAHVAVVPGARALLRRHGYRPTSPAPPPQPRPPAPRAPPTT
ncbi:VanZ family protein [Peterkaempfera bronchialis]|uniref:VanZ family protein n=1 Tax=Peterkaempfera bronchialis TaxID=2126346 RepID=A0A345SVZ7_9ACTN|nr:VanZ family protein [Peterkaempfera bronchialis]